MTFVAHQFIRHSFSSPLSICKRTSLHPLQKRTRWEGDRRNVREEEEKSNDIQKHTRYFLLYVQLHIVCLLIVCCLRSTVHICCCFCFLYIFMHRAWLAGTTTSIWFVAAIFIAHFMSAGMFFATGRSQDIKTYSGYIIVLFIYIRNPPLSMPIQVDYARIHCRLCSSQT